MSTATKHIEDILTSEFKMQNYVDLVREIFSTVTIVAPDNMKKEFSNFSSHVEKYAHVGNYETPDSENIAVFAVELKQQTYVENSRSTQRSYAKKLIENGGCDAALIAFYTPNDKDKKWRLSFVVLDYEMTIENGKMKTEEKVTPAKRYSYLVGQNEPCHTAISRFGKFIRDNASQPTLSEMEDAFSVEAVTKEFFDLYCEKFYQLVDYLESNEAFKGESERCGFSTEQFAKKLMGQIVFLYFLQKKGWLGVPVWPNKLSEKEYKDVFYTTRFSAAQKEQIQKFLPSVYVPVEGGYRLKGFTTLENIPDDVEENMANAMPGDRNWGSGSKTFLRTWFDWSAKHDGKFYDNYLEPLFYATLNKNRGDLGYSTVLHCRVPFLSGGLFDPIDGYDWEHTNFDIPDEIFSNKKSEDDLKADGILDIFDRYNFTMSEDEPMEREVAIDPEMLGKVFENLLDVKDRKSKGAFYTPREIVHYMCQESLVNYLTSNMDVSEDALRSFILYGDFYKDLDTEKTLRVNDSNGSYHMEFDINRELKISPEIFNPKVGIDRINEIDELLKNIRVADPAVGSGAFPLGMLNEIVRARHNCSAYMATKMSPYNTRLMYINERSAHSLKYETVRNCIFASDLEPSAVDIAQLRLWLALVIDDEINPDAQSPLDGHRNPLPLPNLESNILCGNSLKDELSGYPLIPQSTVIGTEIEGQEYSWNQMELESMIPKLTDVQDRLFRCDDPVKKNQIKEEVQSIKEQLMHEQLEVLPVEVRKMFNEAKKQASHPFILWQIEFARVFKEKGGFDIVIGNPPYGAKLSIEDKKLFKQKYSNVHMRTPDTYNYFTSKGLSLLHNRGTIAYIVPNTLLYQNEYEKTRAVLAFDNTLKYVINIGDNVFEKAEVPTCIFISEKSKDEKYEVKYADYRNIPNNEIVWGDYAQKIPISVLKDTPGYVLGVNKQGSQILNKVKEKSVLIDDIALEVAAGISTGGNGVFCITKDFADSNGFEYDILRPMVAGKNVDRYKLNWENEYMIYSTKNTNIPSYKAIYEYMAPFEEKLSKKRETQKGLIPWWSLHWPRTPELFEGKKIIMRQTSDCIRATIDNDDYYALNSLLVLKLNSDCKYSYEYILAVLNSTINNYIYMSLTQEKGRTFAEVKPKNVRKLYVPVLDENGQKEYEDIVYSVLNEEIDIEDAMKRIDNMLYELYGFTEDEISIIESEE